jgi:hypothetical protein
MTAVPEDPDTFLKVDFPEETRKIRGITALAPTTWGEGHGRDEARDSVTSCCHPVCGRGQRLEVDSLLEEKLTMSMDRSNERRDAGRGEQAWLT